MNIGNYLRDALLNEALGGTNFVPAATLEARFFSSALTSAGAGTELSNLGYAPIEIDNDTTNFPTTSDGSKELAVMHESAAAGEDWDGILAIGLFDADDNLYIFENYDEPIEILEGQKLRLPIGSITAEIS